MSPPSPLLRSLLAFFGQADKREALVRVVGPPARGRRKGRVTLRFLQWVCTKAGGGGLGKAEQATLRRFRLGHGDQTLAWGKRLFSPFNSGPRVEVEIPAGETRLVVHTSAPQLNYIRWLVQTGVLSWVEREAILRALLTERSQIRSQRAQNRSDGKRRETTGNDGKQSHDRGDGRVRAVSEVSGM